MPPALQNPINLWLLLTAALAGLVYAFMRPELRFKAIGYGAFLLACAVAVWPPYDREGQPGRIHLGLDLKFVLPQYSSWIFDRDDDITFEPEETPSTLVIAPSLTIQACF